MTFEHVPAQGSLNVPDVIEYRLDDWLQRDEDRVPRGGYALSKGTGAETLCKECNEYGGTWYVPHFNTFVHAGAQLAVDLAEDGSWTRFDTDPELRFAGARIFDVRRLAVLKQIVTMILAINAPEFGKAHPELRTFVSDRERTGLPSRYRFFLSLSLGPMVSRSVGLSAHVENGVATLLTEVVYVPFAYLMTIDAPCDNARGDITAFTTVPYEHTADLEIDLPVGFTHTPFPGDYRSAAAIAAETAALE